MGFCPQCRNDGALLEVAAQPRSGKRRSATEVVSLTDTRASEVVRTPVGIDEFDRVLGGGLVPGAGILLGGEPGVGKSTLVLQVAGSLAKQDCTVLVTSAEESVSQVGLRAARLGVSDDAILLSSERDVDGVIDAARSVQPNLLVVDSIQTIATREVSGAPGGAAQVRESVARLVHFSKDSGVPVILVGHVTKEGGIAGPKLVEHAVDVVLYLEGDPERGLRVLRSLKNRFGATHQVGLFEMEESGLFAVVDPVGLLAAGKREEMSGSVVFPAVDGRRPLLVEVQALVAATSTPHPRRSVKGLEPARVHQIIAVLERHAGLSFSDKDVYVSVLGGIKLRDPGADLPVALALASSLLGKSVGSLAAWGEVGLTGEIRAVAHGEYRALETKRLGLEHVIGPDGGGSGRILTALACAGLLE